MLDFVIVLIKEYIYVVVLIHLHEVKQIHSFYVKSMELCKLKLKQKSVLATEPHLLDSIFYLEFFNQNSIKFKPLQ